MRSDYEQITTSLVQEGGEWILYIQCGEDPRWVLWRDTAKPGRVKVEQLVIAAFQGCKLMHSVLTHSLPIFSYDYQVKTGESDETT